MLNVKFIVNRQILPIPKCISIIIYQKILSYPTVFWKILLPMTRIYAIDALGCDTFICNIKIKYTFLISIATITYDEDTCIFIYK